MRGITNTGTGDGKRMSPPGTDTAAAAGAAGAAAAMAATAGARGARVYALAPPWPSHTAPGTCLPAAELEQPHVDWGETRRSGPGLRRARGPGRPRVEKYARLGPRRCTRCDRDVGHRCLHSRRPMAIHPWLLIPCSSHHKKRALPDPDGASDCASEKDPLRVTKGDGGRRAC